MGAHSLGDAPRFAFERGQIEIRLAVQLGGDCLDLRRANATLAQQARSRAASSQQAEKDVKGSRRPAIRRSQGPRFGQSARVVGADTHTASTPCRHVGRGARGARLTSL